MRHHFANYLDVPVDNITGNHDLSHKLQLSYNDVFKDGPNGPIQKCMKEVFEIMSMDKNGKAGLIFHNVAQDLGHTVLTNKSFQETRLVSATLQGLNTF